MSWNNAHRARKSDYRMSAPDRNDVMFRKLSVGFILICAALTLADCAAVSRVRDWFERSPKGPTIAERPAIPPQPTASPPKPRPQAHEPVKPEKPERIASVDPDSLIGMDPSAIEKVLGTPTRVSKSDISLVWTYAGSGCSFQIFFYPDLKSSIFHVLKYGGIDENGGQILTSQTCVRDILVVRNSAPG